VGSCHPLGTANHCLTFENPPFSAITTTFTYDAENRLTGDCYSDGEPSVTDSFDPTSYDKVHVRKGVRVRLRLRTADRAHGLILDIYPEGVPPVGHPGLIFAHPQDTAKVEHDQERFIEFVAARRAHTASSVRSNAASSETVA